MAKLLRTESGFAFPEQEDDATERAFKEFVGAYMYALNKISTAAVTEKMDGMIVAERKFHECTKPVKEAVDAIDKYWTTVTGGASLPRAPRPPAAPGDLLPVRVSVLLDELKSTVTKVDAAHKNHTQANNQAAFSQFASTLDALVVCLAGARA